MADIVYTGETPTSTLNSNALPVNTDIVIYKGDFVEFNVQVKTSGGVAVDLTGSTPAAVMKSSYSDQSSRPFVCTLTGTPGEVNVFMSSADTKNLLPGSYIWDFQVTSAGGETRTYLTGDVTVYNEVTT